MESFKLFFLLFVCVTVAYGSSGKQKIIKNTNKNSLKMNLPYHPDSNLVTYVHDKITIDLPAFAELVIETQADRILLVTVENAEFLNSHGVVYVISPPPLIH